MAQGPVLQIKSYEETLKTSVDATDAFETQYNYFQDKSAKVDDRRQVGQEMLKQLKNKSQLSAAFREQRH